MSSRGSKFTALIETIYMGFKPILSHSILFFDLYLKLNIRKELKKKVRKRPHVTLK